VEGAAAPSTQPSGGVAPAASLRYKSRTGDETWGAMTWYEFLLFVHVSCAVIWLGGGFVFQVYGLVVQKGGDTAEMATFAGHAGRIGERVFTPAALLVLLAGIGLMIEGSWDWGALWVVFALVAFAGSFALGVGVLSPTAKKLEAVGPETPEGQALTRRIFALLRIDLSFLFAIVFAMTVKPTTDDVGVVLVVAAILAVLTVVFLRGARAAAAGRPSADAAAGSP
jgi:uncharacterized membrane protein